MDGRLSGQVINVLATIRISDEKWVFLPELTLENYGQVLAGKSYEIQTSSGDIHDSPGR